VSLAPAPAQHLHNPIPCARTFARLHSIFYLSIYFAAERTFYIYTYRAMDGPTELERLEKLRADGELTEKEFARAKANILEEPSQWPGDEEMGGGGRDSFDANKWSMWLHLSQLLALVSGPLGIFVPIILWRLKKENSPMVDTNGKHVINGYISYTIYLTIATVLSVTVHHYHWIVVAAVVVIMFVFPIVGATKAQKGICFKHPLSITFIQ